MFLPLLTEALQGRRHRHTAYHLQWVREQLRNGEVSTGFTAVLDLSLSRMFSARASLGGTDMQFSNVCIMSACIMKRIHVLHV